MSDLPPFGELIYELDGHVCTITLNRPHRKNALSATLVNELIVALETAAEDSQVGAIILTGAQGVFCSGADLGQMSGGAGEESKVPWRGGFPELNLAFTQLGKPVIAKVRRYALAGGLGLVAACQFALAEDSAAGKQPCLSSGAGAESQWDFDHFAGAAEQLLLLPGGLSELRQE